MPLFHLISLGPFRAIRIGRWNEPPGRYFLSYECKNDFRDVLGQSVIDEFATFSGPILFGPAPILGNLYNVGISLGHLRDPDMSIDTGWPPLCVGTKDTVGGLPANWEEELLNALQQANEEFASGLKEVEGFLIQSVRIGDISLFATNAPLLPKQLKRICQVSRLPLSLSFSTGNRLTRQKKGESLSVTAVSEAILTRLKSAFEELASYSV